MDSNTITEAEFYRAMGPGYNPKSDEKERLIHIDSFHEDFMACLCDKDVIPDDLQDELNEVVWRVLDIAFPNKY